MNKVINEQSNELCQEFGSLGRGGKNVAGLKKILTQEIQNIATE